MSSADEEKESNGLRRSLSPLNVWALAFGCIIGWGAFVMPGNTFLPTAGPMGTAIAMAFSVVLLVIIAFNYHYMIGKHPVAGGEFTYALDAFGRRHAFVCAWFLGLSYLAIVPLNATALALVSRNLAGKALQFGFHYSVAGYDIYCGELAVAVLALLLFAYLSVRGVKFSGIFQTALVLALLGGVLVIVVAALFSPMASSAALSPAFPSDGAAFASTVAVMAVAPWAFVGFDTVPQAAEEFNFSMSKTRVIMIVSILFGGFVYVALNTITAAVVPDGFANWESYIAALDTCEGIRALPTFHAAQKLLGSAGVSFLGISVLAAILSGIVGFYMATSRLLYSMSREGVLPAWFGFLHPRYGTPSHALLFVMLIALIAPFFGRTALGWVVDMSSLGAAIGYGYTSLAALVKAVQERRWTIVATGIIGTLAALIFATPLLISIPGCPASLGVEARVSLLVWIVLGVVFYACRSRGGLKTK